MIRVAVFFVLTALVLTQLPVAQAADPQYGVGRANIVLKDGLIGCPPSKGGCPFVQLPVALTVTQDAAAFDWTATVGVWQYTCDGNTNTAVVTLPETGVIIAQDKHCEGSWAPIPVCPPTHCVFLFGAEEITFLTETFYMTGFAYMPTIVQG